MLVLLIESVVVVLLFLYTLCVVIIANVDTIIALPLILSLLLNIITIPFDKYIIKLLLQHTLINILFTLMYNHSATALLSRTTIY